MVHPVATIGFGRHADLYESTRPSYPADAVAWLAQRLPLAAGARVIDLGAGTGKLTRLLVPLGASVVAVEPVEGMSEALRHTVPGVPVVSGLAEALPLSDASCDTVVAAQAFHWFDSAATVAELARVTRPGGGVGLLWNARDRTVEWVDRVWSIIDRIEKHAPWRDHDHWNETASDTWPGFGRLEEATFENFQVLSPDGVVARIASVSHVATLPPEEREAVLDEVSDVVYHHPDTRGQDSLSIRYRVDAYVAHRLG